MSGSQKDKKREKREASSLNSLEVTSARGEEACNSGGYNKCLPASMSAPLRSGAAFPKQGMDAQLLEDRVVFTHVGSCVLCAQLPAV